MGVAYIVVEALATVLTLIMAFVKGGWWWFIFLISFSLDLLIVIEVIVVRKKRSREAAKIHRVLMKLKQQTVHPEKKAEEPPAPTARVSMGKNEE